MAKHRRFSDTPKPNSVQKDEKTEPNKQEITSGKTEFNINTILLSGTKYAYIIAATALLCGIFTPLTLGVEFEGVIFGMLSILLGLAGGIVIFFGIKYQKFTLVMVCGGLGMMFGSLVLMHQLIDRPLF